MVKRRMTTVLVIHPFIVSQGNYKVTEETVYECGEALGLAKSLGWRRLPGPFVNYQLKGEAAELGEAPRAEERDPEEPGDAEGPEPMLPEEDGATSAEPWRSMEENSHIVRIRRAHPSSIFNRETLQNLRAYLRSNRTQLVYVNTFLSASQARSIKRGLNPGEVPAAEGIVVIDRLGMILEIFNRRARSEITKVQVALAYLRYAKAQLVREDSNAFLSVRDIFTFDITKPEEVFADISEGRSRFSGGEGESELDIQRRLAKNLENVIKARLEKSLERQRVMAAEARPETPVVALVGYTNSGKSALMNAFVGKNVVESKDLLFQTLYTVKRKVKLRGRFEVQLVDTVGFISKLPKELEPAFVSTLEVVKNSDFVVHVRDASHPQSEAQKLAVEEVLRGMGIDHASKGRLIEVRNKIDLVVGKERGAEALRGGGVGAAKDPSDGSAERNGGDRYDHLRAEPSDSEGLSISATKGWGVPALRSLLERKVFEFYGCYIKRFRFDWQRGQEAMEWFRESAEIKEVDDVEFLENGDVSFSVVVNDKVMKAFEKRFEPQKFERERKLRKRFK